MGKISKRSRKFEASGGIKARLDKGTVTNKGKLKRKRKSGDGKEAARSRQAAADQQLEQARQKKKAKDFMSNENVADMDLESFFAKTVDDMEGGEAEIVDDESDDSSSDDDDDDDEPTKKKGKQKPADNDSDESDSDAEKSNDGDSDSDSGSDNEDPDAAAARMEQAMGKLHQSDPDFHKFLRSNEQELLNFEAPDDEEAEDDDEQDDEEEKKPATDVNTVHVTPDFLKKTIQNTFQTHGVKSLKKFVLIYKTACHMSDADQNDTASKYHIDSRTVFDKVMVTALSRVHEEFEYHLLGKGAEQPVKSKGKKSKDKKSDNEEHANEDDTIRGDDDPIQPKKLIKAIRWPEIKSILQTFFKATMHVLAEGKDPDQLTFVLKALSKYISLISPLPKVSQGLLKTLTSLWCAPLDSNEDYQVVRLNAFLRIRQLAVTQPFPFIEECLKKTYLAYAKRAKYGTAAAVTSALPTLTFMGNCLVELYSLDFHSSYQHAFVYIRQLALHMRAAVQKKTPESLQAVYCWQYVHCLKLWTAVLAQACKMAGDPDTDRRGEAELLRSLVYPLTELIFGVARIIPTTRRLPLRLHCVRFLQQLASASETFVPTAATLLAALELKELGQKPKRDKTKNLSRGIQLPLIITLPKDNALRTMEQQEACVSEVFILLNREIDLYRYNPGFPEYAVHIKERLRKFNKNTKNKRFRAYGRGCIDLCDSYTKFATLERSKLQEAPKDVKKLEALKPSNAPSMLERYEAAISKEKRLEEVSRPATKKENVQKKQVRNDNKKEDDASGSNDDSMEDAFDKGKRKSPQPVEKDGSVLEQEDEVKEGINWSDEEDDNSE